MPCPYTWHTSLPVLTYLYHPTPADHSSGSLAAETLDGPFFLGPHALFFYQATSSWGWGLVSLSGCGMSSTGLARSYVCCGSAQEEGIGNSVGGGIRAFRDWKRFLLGTPPRAGHRPRPLLFVWAQEDGNSLCFGGHLLSSSGDLVSDTWRPLSGLGSHLLLHRQ